MVNTLSSVATLLKVKGGNIKNYIGEDAEHRNSHSLLMKFIADEIHCKMFTATSEDSLAVSYKVRHKLTIQPSNHAPR